MKRCGGTPHAPPIRYCSVKCTVTVMTTATGTPLSSVGELPLPHGVECRLIDERNRPQDLRRLDGASGAIVASMITTPWTCADWAIEG